LRAVRGHAAAGQVRGDALAQSGEAGGGVPQAVRLQTELLAWRQVGDPLVEGCVVGAAENAGDVGEHFGVRGEDGDRVADVQGFAGRVSPRSVRIRSVTVATV